MPHWRRTVKVRNDALGGGYVEVDAPRRRMTPALYGRQCERDARKELTRAGYSVTLSHLSRGAADLVATSRTDTVFVQVKSCRVFRPSFLNAGIAEIICLETHSRREVWGYVYGKGHVVTVAVDADEALSVGGREPYRGQVEAALGRRRG